ncbi:cytidine deaminase-like protein [Durotheca rogersii]|uniref:cytidine deaminase-like protein n=1 Tax=Durotheca rogersii TaxID=419775 RepID=UPI00221F6563|nr:cytidine deaminase-like protein [Durotheca rogersii]KAI5867706.1 cytidine deaminase-like protein [Durotheca rogersii]
MAKQGTMEGQKFSGYMSSLWHALFAPFLLLFTRISRFTSARQGPRQDARESSYSPSQPRPPHQPHPPRPPQQTSPSTHLTQPAPDPSPSPSPSSIPPSTSNPTISQSPPGDSAFVDLEQGRHSISRHYPREDDDSDYCDCGDDSDGDGSMASSKKKRGGQKRGGPNSNGPRPIAPHAPPADAPNASANTAHASHCRISTPASTGVVQPGQPGQPAQAGRVPATSQGDNNGTAPPTKNRKRSRSRKTGRNRGSSPPKPALDPLSVAGKARNQKTGPGSPHTTTEPSTTSKAGAEGTCQSKQVDKICTETARLTLDDITGMAGVPVPTRPEVDTTQAVPDARAVSAPVPVAVALPLTRAPVSRRSHNDQAPTLPGLIEPKTDEERAERAYHLKFMQEALDMGNLALNTNETPVGCVLVCRGRVVARGMNATNVTRNGTRHAEFMALSALLSRKEPHDAGKNHVSPNLDDASWGEVDPRDGHIYPYGQKLHPAPVVDRSILSECVLYVTVEPCVMCASLLRQLGIKKVYFGAVNDKFGGTGGVFRIHMNSKPVPRPSDRPYQNGYGPHDVGRIVRGRATVLPRDEDDGDGGNVEPGYPVEGGYLRNEAVSLLRRFYVQENGRAPQPRKKEGRAARLFAMENSAKNGACPPELSDAGALAATPAMDSETPAADGENGEGTDNSAAV